MIEMTIRNFLYKLDFSSFDKNDRQVFHKIGLKLYKDKI